MEDFWYEFVEVTQAIADGLLFGSTYALIGIGFTLIFGAMGKLNMAYAAAALGGAYAGLAGFVLIKAPLVLVFGISAAAAAGLGYAIYFACFRFIPVNNHLAALMASVGGLFFIDEVVVHVTRGSPLTFPSMFSDVFFELGPYGIRGDLVFVFIIGLVSTGVLLYILFRTRLGLATRAVSQQDIAARLCGIGVHTTNSVTFTIAGILGGVAGAMTAAAVGVLSPVMTVPLTVKGIIVAVIGGLGSIPGAIIAGLFVGGFENVFLYFRGIDERDMYVVALLFLFLVFRPNGLFGTAITRD
ncbi:MAG: branched-chain amino acid ABC transporter permease [Pseudomonadota bacterium]|nr:branched-chain amino acid ABC transporter permease [Pseudomonadota bacterium]MEE3280829.1 branched-chain amino acid ABC transporter permease [Pseudomonadota bacterium]